MRNKTFTDWIQITGNIGLVAGLILVAVQIRDSNRIASAEMFSASIESTVAINTAQFGDTPQDSMSRVLYTPTVATVEDFYVADRVYDALVRILVRVHVFEDLGVYGSEEITPRGFVQMHYHAFACPYGLSWLDQSLERLRGPNNRDAPILKSLELMRNLASVNPAQADFDARREQTDRLLSRLLGE